MKSQQVGQSLHKDKYRRDIDGLRAIAVGSVVLSHAFPRYIPGGFIGVDIFFVISGYLISKIIINDCAENNFSILRFYDRRIRRIFPALLTVLAFVLGCGWFCLFRPEFLLLGRHVVASTLFVENFLLWSEASYFDVSSALKPTLHLWSLAIEEQFYILWPLILYVSHRWRLPFIGIFLVVGGLSFAINIYDIHTDMTAAYYSPLGRSWELMVGSVLAYIEINHPKILARSRNMQSLVGLGLILIALALLNSGSDFPGFWALLPTAGTFLLIACGSDATVNRRILALTPMVWVGLISYPLYLWHWVILSGFQILMGAPNGRMASVCIAAAVVLATATFFFIERPLRMRRAGKAQPLALVALAICLLGVSVPVARGLIAPRLKNFAAPTATEWTELLKQWDGASTNMEQIYHLPAAGPDQVLFIGDSHLAQYAARLRHIQMRDGRILGATLAIGGGCVPIEGTRTDDSVRAKCWALRKEGYRLANKPQYKRIIIGGAWNWYFMSEKYYFTSGGRHIKLSTKMGRELALSKLADRISAWKRAGKEVIFILDNPQSAELNLVSWRGRLGLNASNYVASGAVRIKPGLVTLHSDLAEWAKAHSIDVVDSFAAVCQGDVCQSTTKDRIPIYKDGGHFNPDWSVHRAKFIDRTLAPIES